MKVLKYGNFNDVLTTQWSSQQTNEQMMKFLLVYFFVRPKRDHLTGTFSLFRVIHFLPPSPPSFGAIEQNFNELPILGLAGRSRDLMGMAKQIFFTYQWDGFSLFVLTSSNGCLPLSDPVSLI